MPATADTPTRLLDAAERLIAERGVDAVSLRSINTAAGANVAAIHYHFGTKADLLQAVLARRGTQLRRERQTRLDALGADPSLRDVVAVAVLPFLELASTPDGASWAGFLAAMERAGDPWVSMARGALGPEWQAVVAELARHLPHLSPPELRFRLAAMGAVVTGPALHADAPGPEAIVELCAAVLSAPVPQPV